MTAYELEKDSFCIECNKTISADEENFEEIFSAGGAHLCEDCVDNLIYDYGTEYIRDCNMIKDYIEARGCSDDMMFSAEELNAFLNNTPEIVAYVSNDKGHFVDWWCRTNGI